MDIGGCAALWREHNAPSPAVVDLQDEAAADEATRREQEERERQVGG
jgi:hypothetical protein